MTHNHKIIYIILINVDIKEEKQVIPSSSFEVTANQFDYIILCRVTPKAITYIHIAET